MSSMSTADTDAMNPYLVAVLVLVPMGGLLSAVAFLAAEPMLAWLLGAGFFGAVISMLGYGVRERLADSEPSAAH